MKRTILIALLAAMIGGEAFGQPELIVRPHDGSTALIQLLEGGGVAKARDQHAALFEGVEALRPVVPAGAQKHFSGRSIPAFVIQAADSSAFRDLLQRWSEDAAVEYVQPNFYYRLDGAAQSTGPVRRAYPADDPLADSLGHLDVIRAREAWSITPGTPEVRVGLVDTGLMLDHPDLRAQLGVNPGEDLNENGRVDASDFNGVDDDGNGFVDDIRGFDFVDRPEEVEAGDFSNRDADPALDPLGAFSGHATNVAGALVAARNGEGIAGVAPGVTLVPLRAFAGDGRGATDDIAAAILYAAAAGLDVINLSFGRDYAAPLLREAIRYAVDQGTIVVASAGNNGGDEAHYPSDYPEVISVAWLTRDGEAIAGRGEHGIGIDLGAPGTAIFTTIVPSDEVDEPAVSQLYGRRSGSSMAAPQVAGAAALLRSVDGTLSPAAVQNILTASAVDLQAEGWDHTTAAGRLDVAAALARALPARTEIISPEHDGGTAQAQTPIVGSAVDPSFSSFSLYYARGTEDLEERPDPWTRIAGPVHRQRYRDTLATWDTEAVDEGEYTLRLVTTLRGGRTVEDRRRVFIDRSPPRIRTTLLQPGLVGRHHGVVGDVITDDPTTLTASITLNGRAHTVSSEVRNRRHGISWADERGRGGTAQVRLEATNPAGQSAVFDTVLTILSNRTNTAFMSDERSSVPDGYLLPRATDFDGDGLLEVVLNAYENGALGDSLVVHEWSGTGFSRASAFAANVIPRDVGDTNDNGQLELLTQVSGATLLLEQVPGEAFPRTTLFVDTLGLRDPNAANAVWGARLTDLDQDGRGEILSHNQSVWRPLEVDGDTYRPIAHLANPTDSLRVDPNVDANAFQQPEALVDDFDGDGLQNLLVGDSDGDWIMYESTGDDAFEVVWTFETPRINAGDRFGKGDWDGDGDVDFVTYTENLPILNDRGEREPPLGIYYLWSTTGDDQFELMRTLPVQGNGSRHGSLQHADFDGDGRDEIAIIHPPHLYVMDWTPGAGWDLLHTRPAAPPNQDGLRSIAAVTDDFDGDGVPELLAATADGRVHRFIPQRSTLAHPPPRWVEAHAVDASAVRLAWEASRSDSVTVFAGPEQGALDPVTTTTQSALTLNASQTRRYAVRAWYGLEASPLSTVRSVRPHEPARVTAITYPDPRSVQLRFSEPLKHEVDPAHVALDETGPPEQVLFVENGAGLLFRFAEPPQRREDTLRWAGIVDREGTPVGQRAAAVAFPAPDEPPLVISAWKVLDRQRVALTFSAALHPDAARTLANYRLQPQGTVSAVQFEDTAPERVVVEIDGAVIGATGREVSLRVVQMRGASGETLAEEGNAIRLVQPAADLDDVYVYPNPYRASRHGSSVTVAGLPAEATVRIVTVQGGLVRVLRETSEDGGLEWDLRDERGQLVPSGMYLLRIESPNQSPVLKKAAIIR